MLDVRRKQTLASLYTLHCGITARLTCDPMVYIADGEYSVLFVLSVCTIWTSPKTSKRSFIAGAQDG